MRLWRSNIKVKSKKTPWRNPRLLQNNKYWHQCNVTMTFRRRNTFINLGYTDFISTIRQSIKRRKFKNTQGRFTRTLSYISAGLCGLKGAKKAAPMANLTIGARAAAKFKKFSYMQMFGRFFGSGRRRRELMKGLARNGLLLGGLSQETWRPHNGVRHKKRRRK